MGDKITVNDLLYGLMLKSGNDCAIALAEYVGNSVDNFVGMMNEKAVNMNLKNTHFVTVNGLDADEHYTTAVELAKLADYALDNDAFKRIVGTKECMVYINGYGKAIDNTNELLGYLDGVYGVKTGFTNGANRCLVTSIKRGNMDVISVVLGADTKKDRTMDSIKIIEYVYSNYQMMDLSNNIESFLEDWKEKNKINIIKGTSECLDIELIQSDNRVIPVYIQHLNTINVSISCMKQAEAPIKKGDKVGTLEVKIDNKVRVCIDLVASEEVIKKDGKRYFIEMLSNINNYFKMAFQ